MTLLTFIIPVRHQDNARDWAGLKAKLAHTLRSVANQTNGDWRGIIVANEGADLPDLPDKFSVTRVTFPPNDLHELGKASKDAVLDAFRADKGRRVLRGMLDGRDSRFFMIVDDDDFVSSGIVQFVADHAGSNGWMITDGYLWNEGGKLLFASDDFNHKCGTCLIVRSDIYGLPARFEDAELIWIKDMLGSHVRIGPILAERGTPLGKLPFPGAVYRVGSSGSHSQAPTFLRQYIFNRRMVKHPIRFMAELSKVRVMTDGHRREFFGAT